VRTFRAEVDPGCAQLDFLGGDFGEVPSGDGGSSNPEPSTGEVVGLDPNLTTPHILSINQGSVGVRVFYSAGTDLEQINVEINGNFIRTITVRSTSDSFFFGNNLFVRGQNTIKLIGLRGEATSQPSAEFPIEVDVPAGPGNILLQERQPTVVSDPSARQDLAGIQQGVQYVQPGFSSSILMSNGSQVCRVPNQFYSGVQEDSERHSRLENILNSQGGSRSEQLCNDSDFR